jgi:hypothetical protein
MGLLGEGGGSEKFEVRSGNGLWGGLRAEGGRVDTATASRITRDSGGCVPAQARRGGESEADERAGIFLEFAGHTAFALVCIPER